MSISRLFYEPFFTVSDFDRLFDEAYSARAGQNQQQPQQASQQQVQRQDTSSGVLRPRMDLHENPESNTVIASFELPGLQKENVAIDVHNNRLTVSGESTISQDRDEEGYAIRERRFGKFSRTLQLPQGVKDEEIKASMENGVLTVTFPRSAPEAAPKKISIA